MTLNRPPRRILIVTLADIGDLVTVTPALAALRQHFPEAQLTLLTTPHAAPVVESGPLADHVLIFPKQQFDRPRALLNPQQWSPLLKLAWTLFTANYDTVLILRHLTTRFGAWKHAALALITHAGVRAGLDNGRGWFLTHRVTDEGFGARSETAYWQAVVALLGDQMQTQPQLLPSMTVTPADREWAAQRLPEGLRYAAIHAGSGGYSLARRWEPSKFAAVADALQTQGWHVVLVGGKHDDIPAVCTAMQQQTAVTDLSGQTTLGQLAAVLARCQRYIGADSGVAHIASTQVGATLTQLDILFGPSNHQAWRPAVPQASVIRSGVRCSPCSYVGHSVGLRNGCSARTCMKLLTPADILQPSTISLPPPSLPPALHLLGVPIHRVTFASLLDQLEQWIVSGGIGHQICTVNPEYIMLAQQNELLFNILQRADLNVADGVGILYAARWLGQSLPERVTGSDGVPLIAERAAQRGWRLFLLGAADGVAQRTADILTSRYAGLHIVGTYAGNPNAEEEDHIAALVRASQADILFVAYGMGKQDHWIARNLPRLGVNVAIGVGGSFDFIAGTAHRAPRWARQWGIEWLHRLVKEPWRWKRMLALPRFVLACLWRGQRGPQHAVNRK